MLGTYLKLIPAFPLLAMLINAFLIRYKLKAFSYGLVSFCGAFIPFILLVIMGVQVSETGPITGTLWSWAVFDGMNLDVAFLLDELSLCLSLVVMGIGGLITLFAIGYMEEDEGVGRFFSYLSLFIFFMILLTLSENFLVLFFGWEGVGLCSYLLIGFWYEDWEKALAGKKALVVNRIGDLGIILGIIGFSVVFNSFSFMSFKTFDPALLETHSTLLIFSSLCFVLGVTGKSAQLPLYVWLPDAMAGPTPVSALIHAATMVTAGIFLLCRLSFVFVQIPVILDVIAWIGALTAFLGAFIAIAQTDIKKVLAYSTVSQLGYMVLACGAGAFSSAMFHVITHAFFKALLFLSAGAIIYALHHEQDIFKMGKLKKEIPEVYWCFLIGLLAIAGIPGLSGFFSKDEILWAVLNRPVFGKQLYAIALITAFMTAFYMTRLFLNVFIVDHGKSAKKHHAEKVPYIMLVPLILLAAGSVLIGLIGLPHYLTHDHSQVLHKLLGQAVAPMPAFIMDEKTEYLAILWTVAGVIFSMGLAYLIYVMKGSEKLAAKLKEKFSLAWEMSSKKLWVDELLDLSVVKGVRKLSEAMSDIIEKYVIDGAIRGIAFIFYESSVLMVRYRMTLLDGNILYFIIGTTFVLMILFNYMMTK